MLLLTVSFQQVYAAPSVKEKDVEPKPYVYVPVQSKENDLFILSASSLFQPKTYNDSGELQSIGKPLNYKGLLNNNVGALFSDENFIRTSFVSMPMFKLAKKQDLVFKSSIEFAGNASLIPQNSSFSIHQGLRLGFDTANVYYEMPMGLVRYDHTKQTQIIISGNLNILPLAPVQKITSNLPYLEANFSNIVVKKEGNVSIGKKFTSKGFHSENSKLTFYDSILSSQYMVSNNDTISIYGNVRFISEGKEPSVLNSKIFLVPTDSYHASEIVNRVNDTILHLDGHFKAQSAWVYDIAMNSDKIISLPKVKTSAMNHFENVTIEIDALVLETYQTEPANVLKNTKFPLIESRVEIVTLPKIGQKTQEVLKNLQSKLVLSADKKTLYIAFE
ncbi:MAG: hypothetical protein Q8K37_04690, partial [Alphaproteobacteria bacterium]|nr:hypothetical protein [Alphaproteobacteria bacterium]